MYSEIDLNIILNGNTELSLDQSNDILSAVFAMAVFFSGRNVGYLLNYSGV
jgi:hypothetical protein